MAVIEGADGTLAKVTPEGAILISEVTRDNPYTVSASTGTIAAALAANSALFVARVDPASTKKVVVSQIRLRWVCLVAFTVPLTAGRRLSLYVGSGANSSGGTDIVNAGKKKTTAPESKLVSANGGSMRVSTTGALTVTGITFATPELEQFPLAAYGNAGNVAETVFDYKATGGLELLPGELLAIRNPQLMDAAGTWQLTVDMDWAEVPI